jgi:hypothetical protein
MGSAISLVQGIPHRLYSTNPYSLYIQSDGLSLCSFGFKFDGSATATGLCAKRRLIYKPSIEDAIINVQVTLYQIC